MNVPDKEALILIVSEAIKQSRRYQRWDRIEPYKPWHHHYAVAAVNAVQAAMKERIEFGETVVDAAMDAYRQSSSISLQREYSRTWMRAAITAAFAEWVNKMKESGRK